MTLAGTKLSGVAREEAHEVVEPSWAHIIVYFGTQPPVTEVDLMIIPIKEIHQTTPIYDSRRETRIRANRLHVEYLRSDLGPNYFVEGEKRMGITQKAASISISRHPYL